MAPKLAFERIGRRLILGSNSSSWPSRESVNAMNFLASSAFLAPATSAILAGTTEVTLG